MNLKKILLVALMIISVLAIAGCGEEEKYNTAKKELVQITDTFKTIKATDENKTKFEEAYKKAESKLAEMEKFSKSDTRLTNDYLQTKADLEQKKKLWNTFFANERELQKSRANQFKTMKHPNVFEGYELK